jgi:hypothetical protein
MPEPNDAPKTDAGAGNTGAVASQEVIDKAKKFDEVAETFKSLGFGMEQEDIDELLMYANRGAEAMRKPKPEEVKDTPKVETKPEVVSPAVEELETKFNRTMWENKVNADRIDYMLAQKELSTEGRDNFDAGELESLIRNPNTGPAIFALSQDKGFGKNLYKAAAQFVKVQKGAAIGKEQGIKMAQDLEKSKQALAGESGQKIPDRKPEDKMKMAADIIAPDTKYIP